jgi:hypothetical protein
MCVTANRLTNTAIRCCGCKRNGFGEKTMSKENDNKVVREAGIARGGAKKLSEDARGLGPMEVGSVVIGRVEPIVGEGGIEVPGFVATKDEILQIVR